MVELILAGGSGARTAELPLAVAVLAEELARHYGLRAILDEEEGEDDDAADICVTVTIDAANPGHIPVCSLTRVAENDLAAGQPGAKYARSMLKIDRKATRPAVATTTPALVHDDSELVVGVRSGRSPATGAFDKLQDAGDRAWATPADDDVCCICLDPLLLPSRARNGESLAYLDCKHMLHSACARDARVAKLRTPSGSMAMTVGPRAGTSAPDLGKLQCPICRIESSGVTELPLTLVHRATGRPISPKEPAPARAQQRKKKVSESSAASFDPVAGELLAMGFQEPEVLLSLEASGGSAAKAVEMLLGN